MSKDIDWSKAPDATHYTPGNPEEGLNAVFWRVIEGVNVKAWAVRSNGSIAACRSSCEFDFSRADLVTRSPEWDGEGLPPVGTVCEFAGGTHCPEDPFDKDLKEGMPVTIIAHFKSGDFTLAAFTFDPKNPDRGMVQVEQGNFGCFRPIRTAEQIAAEERSIAISEMVRLVGWSHNYPGAAAAVERIYDAGYRKQVTQ